MLEPRLLRQCSPQERAAIADFLGAAVVGGPDTVRDGLQHLATATGADELLLVCDVLSSLFSQRSPQTSWMGLRCFEFRT